MHIQQVMDAIEHLAPRRLAEDWDNPGLLVGDPGEEVRGIVTCLDVSDAVIDFAVKNGANLIVAHHPLIFRAQKHIRTDLPLGHTLQKLLIHGIAVYAAHTNLDIAVGGVNDVLANAIGLRKLSAFVITSQDENGHTESLGRIGTLPEPMRIEDFAEHVRQSLHADHIRYVNATPRHGGASVMPRPVRRVALCSGAGAEYLDRAHHLGADAYLTGDVRYHDAQHAMQLGIHLIDAGHFATEYPIALALADYLTRELEGTVPIYEDNFSHDFFTTL